MGKHKKNDNTRGFLKVALVLIVIAIICVLAYGGKYYIGDQKQVSLNENDEKQVNVAANETKKGEEKVKVEPVIEEELKEDEINEEEKPQVVEEQKEETENEEVAIDEEDKAIELAKKEFGMTDGVYFTIEHIESANVYVVSVRDSQTTRDLAWYTVDVKNGTVK